MIYYARHPWVDVVDEDFHARSVRVNARAHARQVGVDVTIGMLSELIRELEVRRLAGSLR